MQIEKRKARIRRRDLSIHPHGRRSIIEPTRNTIGHVAHVESHALCLTKVIEPQHYLVYTYNKYIYLCIDHPPGSLYRRRCRSAPRGFALSSAAEAPFDRRVRARASLARRRVPPPGGIFARGYPRRCRGNDRHFGKRPGSFRDHLRDRRQEQRRHGSTPPSPSVPEPEQPRARRAFDEMSDTRTVRALSRLSSISPEEPSGIAHASARFLKYAQ